MRTTAQRTSPARGLLAAVAIAGLLMAGCADNGNGDEEAGTGNPNGSEAEAVSHSGVLAAVESADDAYTYDTELAPEGAELGVEVDEGDTTSVTLSVRGLVPDRAYAAHAHSEPCGADGSDAGPHFQHEVDPNQPSTDPDYANPDNEIWLDFATDGAGDAEVTAEVPFGFAERAPASVVVHAEAETATEEGEAGAAGDRLACLTAPFDSSGQ
ncbi:superoxide dismutase family protein [Haloechinothrix alba]|nr:superoxide dismutase family protein [Haloechinothrix alba]